MQVTYLQRTVGGLDWKYQTTEDIKVWIDLNHPVINGILTLYNRQGAKERLKYQYQAAYYNIQTWDGNYYGASQIQLVGGFEPYYIAI